MIPKVLVSGVAVVLIFGFAVLLLPLLLPFLFLPGVVPAMVIAATFTSHLKAWGAANEVEGPIMFAALAGVSSILIWWILCVFVWMWVERVRTRRS